MAKKHKPELVTVTPAADKPVDAPVEKPAAPRVVALEPEQRARVLAARERKGVILGRAAELDEILKDETRLAARRSGFRAARLTEDGCSVEEVL